MTEDTRAITVRLTEGRYERLRREAYERHVPMSEIINEALDGHFAGKLAMVVADVRWILSGMEPGAEYLPPKTKAAYERLRAIADDGQ